MKNKKTFLSVVLLLLVLTFTGCAMGKSPNDWKSYFSNFEKKTVKYDESKDNLDEAGTYWTFTADKDETLTIGVTTNALSMYSTMYCYVNGTQVKSEDTTESMYTFLYKNIDLKKGDKLEFHAFSTNSLMVDSVDYEISLFSVNDYPISEVK